MADVVGIRFKAAGRIYHFDPSSLDLQVNDQVVVRTNRGLELGIVTTPRKQVPDAELTEPLQPVVRKAEPDDMRKAAEFSAKEIEVLGECSRMVEKLKLPMKLLSAEYNLEGNRLTVFFSAEERVDFRDLVREMAGRFKVKVELRQVGPRDETKLIGGFGRCGRPLCCGTFLTEFAPVSIKMAKEQNLPLNPMKISGICGRLMCCLTYENQVYKNAREKMPRVGAKVTTKLGNGEVVGVNPLKDSVLVKIETSEGLVECPVAEVTRLPEPPRPERAARDNRPRRPEPVQEIRDTAANADVKKTADEAKNVEEPGKGGGLPGEDKTGN